MRKPPPEPNNSYKLNPDYVLSTEQIVSICRVSDSTARRYLKTGMAPYLACRLIDLHQRGRILPERWKHSFINFRDQLEFYQIGEVSEDEVLNAQWLVSLAENNQRSIQRQLNQANERIAQLLECLDAAQSEMGQVLAANDSVAD